MTEEVNIKASSTPDTKATAPISIEDLGATMKPIHTMTTAHRVPREVEAAIATRRSINPPLMTFAITLMPVWMPLATSKIVGPHAMK